MAMLFQNATDQVIELQGPENEIAKLEPGQKKVLDVYYKRYIPEKLRPIRSEPSSILEELTTRPLNPVEGQFYLNTNKQELQKFDGKDWQALAVPGPDNTWQWLGEDNEAPDEALPEIGIIGKRKLNI